MKKTDKQILMI